MRIRKKRRDCLTDGVCVSVSVVRDTFRQYIYLNLCIYYRSEEEMLKFMSLMNSSWAIDGHDVVTAFDLSRFNSIVDVGGVYTCPSMFFLTNSHMCSLLVTFFFVVV